jgi:hypothetical protein
MTQGKDPRSYTQDEVEAILRRALERRPADALSHQDLLDSARAVGIDAETLEAAAAELREERALQREKEARQVQRRRRFGRSLLVYVLVNALLFGIDMLTTGGTWFYWVLFGWGLGMVAQLMALLMPREETQEQRQRRLEHEARRAAKRQAREVRKDRRREAKDALERGTREFEQAVEQGVGHLLSAVARQIETHVSRGQGGQGGPGAPRVRVEHEREWEREQARAEWAVRDEHERARRRGGPGQRE